MVDLTIVGMAVLSALAYVLYGVLRAKANGEPLSLSRVLPVVVAAVFLAIIAPELIPADPSDVFTLPAVALTAFAMFGALFVLQRLYAVAVAVYFWLINKLDALQMVLSSTDEDADLLSKKKPKPRVSQH